MDERSHIDECAVVGFGTAEGTLDDIARLRQNPGQGRPPALEHQILKHADEHTVLALAAMLNGLAAFQGISFADWAVVAAPRWPGRLGAAHALDRLHADGARGVSPLAIPTLCLHSLSGTVSLVFAMHGSNFGVSGGLASVGDGLLAGLTVQVEQKPPGTWVILAEWETEPGQVNTQTPPRAHALALALGASKHVHSGLRLSIRPSPSASSQPIYPRLEGLVAFLRKGPRATDHVSKSSCWKCTLDWGMELVLGDGGAT